MSLHFKCMMGLVVLLSFSLNLLQFSGALVLCVLGPRLRRRFHTWLQRIWVDSIATLMHPVKVIVTGDTLAADEPAIFIVNHQVDTDWWFMWVLAQHYNRHGHLKIILKDTLKWLPVMGWGMRFFEFIFLHRDLKQDGPILRRGLERFVREGFPFWLLLFPEGNTVHEEGIARCQQFAKEQDRPVLTRLLLPRTNGFTVVLGAVPESTKVYDCTMVYGGYTGDIPDWNDGYERKKDKSVPSLRKMFTGMQPPPTHIHIRQCTAADVKACGIQKWLDERWVEKDAILAHYATTGHMPQDKVGPKTLEVISNGSTFKVLLLAGVELIVAGLVWRALW